MLLPFWWPVGIKKEMAAGKKKKPTYLIKSMLKFI